jgi:hypothetical protein
MSATHKTPPPPPRRAIPIGDDDIIDVIVGQDEERLHMAKRRLAHEPPADPGVVRVVVPASLSTPIIVTPDLDIVEDEERQRIARLDGGGVVESELAMADTARYEDEELLSEAERARLGRDRAR